MNVTVLYNQDADEPDEDPGHAARADIEQVAEGIAAALERHDEVEKVKLLPCWGRRFRFVRRLLDDPPDLVFNLCESLVGDSRGELAIPAILDSLGIPYTGSSAVGLTLALHKPRTKAVLRGSGVPAPLGFMVRRIDELDRIDLPFPLIVKPAREDASVGISRRSVVHDRAELAAQVREIHEKLRQEALVERYVDGREIYVAMLGNGTPDVLPFTEIDFSGMPPDRPRIVTYEAKWVPGSEEDRGTTPSIVAIQEPALELRLRETARDAFRALELQDYGRVDVRVGPDGTPYVIDVNPNCDLSNGAGFSRAAAAAGLSYDALIRRIVDVAQERIHGDPARATGRHGPAPRAAVLHRELLERGGRVRARARGAGSRRDG